MPVEQMTNMNEPKLSLEQATAEFKSLCKEFVEIPKGVYKMGWTAIIPAISLLWLAIIVIRALYH